MSRLLTIYHKHNVTSSEESLALFKGNLGEFVRWFISADESWVYHYTGDQAAVETVNCSGRIDVEQDQDESVSQQRHGNDFFGNTRYNHQSITFKREQLKTNIMISY